MRNALLGAVAAATACALLAPAPARAWHENGHMAVALIAYRQLNDAGQQKVQAVLRKHPHYDLFLAADAPADAKPDEWVVMRAAVWPDWVRNPRSAPQQDRGKIRNEFSHPEWHYVNKPIKYLEGVTEEEQTRINDNASNPKKERGQILVQFPKLVAGVKAPADSDVAGLVSSFPKPTIDRDGARAIALCWLLHLGGDIHQPLHAAALFSKDSLDGDHGGNSYIVRWKNQATDLHTLMDGGFGWDNLHGADGSKYAAVDTLARDLLIRVTPTAEERAVATINAWADESQKLAEKKIYFVNNALVPGQIHKPGTHRPHASDLDPLPDGYANVILALAEQRVTLGGYRMGNLLKDILTD